MVSTSYSSLMSKQIGIAGTLLMFCSMLTWAESAPVFSLTYTGDAFQNVSGGIRTGSEYLDLVEVSVETDFVLSDSWVLSTSIQGLHSNGHSITERLAGDVQVLSSLDGGGSFTKLGQATVELSTSALSLLFGLYDINAEFDVLESASLFVNSAHGIGSDIALTGENGPSIYPFYSLGGRMKLTIDNNQSIKLALLDAVPGSTTSFNAPQPEFDSEDGLFAIAEYAYSTAHNKWLFGGWGYSKTIEVNSRQTRNIGANVRHEHQFKDQRTRAFFRIGYAYEHANLHDWFLSGGINYVDPFNVGTEDVVGIAIAHLLRGAKSESELLSANHPETAFELTYLRIINQHFYVQPNIQYIENSGFEDRHALVAGIRLHLSL
jgi:porin